MALNDSAKSFVSGTGTTAALAITDFNTNLNTLVQSGTGPNGGLSALAFVNSGMGLTSIAGPVNLYTFWAQVSYLTKA